MHELLALPNGSFVDPLTISRIEVDARTPTDVVKTHARIICHDRDVISIPFEESQAARSWVKSFAAEVNEIREKTEEDTETA